MKKYVAYYRVSTQKQGISGLGLAAQETMVKQFVKCDDCIIAAFTEVESGKKDNRPELEKAIAYAKKEKAVLVIAKLDRLSRNVGFLFTLKDAGVNFVCADMPDLNTLTLAVHAGMAQHERELISKRTKEALQAKKASNPDWKPGTPANLTPEARRAGLLVRQQNALQDENTVKAAALAVALREKGETLTAIAEVLNKKGFKTRRGNKIVPASVQRLLDKRID